MESIRLVSLSYDGRILYKGRVYNLASQTPQVLGLRCYVYDTNGQAIGLDFDMDTVGSLWADKIQKNNLVTSSVCLYLPKDTDTLLTEDEIEGKVKIYDCSLERSLLNYIVDTLISQGTIQYQGNSLSCILTVLGYIQSKFRSKSTGVLSGFGKAQDIYSYAFEITTKELRMVCDYKLFNDTIAMRFSIHNNPELESRRVILVLTTSKLGTFGCLSYIGEEILNIVGTMLVVLKAEREGRETVTYNNKVFKIQSKVIGTKVTKQDFEETIVIER